jgi:hypothetical protein
MSRWYVAHHLGIDQFELAWLEEGFGDIGQDIIDGYQHALDHLRANSLPAKSPSRLIWSAPSTVLTREERMLWADIDAYGDDD